ncbi:MAG: sugar phosphate isomerase/epimerase [Gemmatimonadetes bacterium]|nr:MAG: sugar phosphate isomerase/epimerase [Gemmatimonadota bacterium]
MRSDRREFVKTLAAAGIAIACPGALRTARAAEGGHQEAEFAGYHNHSPADVRAILDRHGLSAPSTHVPFESDDQWKAALDAAKTIGHEYIVMPFIPAERRKTLDDWKNFAQVFNHAGQAAHDAGIQFAYHNHDFEFPKLDGQIPYDVLLQNTDPKLVQLEIDLYWITKAGQDPLAYFARWPGRVPLVHVKDSAGPPEHKMVDVGQGKIDWKRIFAKKDQAGIKHFIVEHDQPPQPFEDIATSARYLKSLEF